MFWKFFRTSAAFLMGLILFLAVTEYLLQKHLPSSGSAGEGHYRELFSPSVKADVILIGTSTTAHGMDTAYLDTVKSSKYDFSRIFNFALGGARFQFYSRWYPILFKRYYPKPSLAIIGVNPFTFMGTDSKILENDSSYYPLPILVQLLFDSRLSKKQLIVNSLWIFTIHLEREEMLHLFYKKTETSGIRLDLYDRGFVPLDGHIDPNVKLVNENNTLNPDEVRAFTDLLDQLKRDGVDVILVETPEYLPALLSSPDDAFLKKIAAERNLPFLNYNDEHGKEINRNPAYFIHSVHLNIEGTKAFSTLLKKNLETLLK